MFNITQQNFVCCNAIVLIDPNLKIFQKKPTDISKNFFKNYSLKLAQK